jgi:hypothetical protein
MMKRDRKLPRQRMLKAKKLEFSVAVPIARDIWQRIQAEHPNLQIKNEMRAVPPHPV